MFRGLSGPHLHQPAATQEAAGHAADHGANGPEEVVAAGGSTTEEMGPAVVRSRRWCCMEFTRDVTARLAIYSTSVLYLRSLRRPLFHPNPKGRAVLDWGGGHPPRAENTETGATRSTSKAGRGLPVVRRCRRAPRRALDFHSADTSVQNHEAPRRNSGSRTGTLAALPEHPEGIKLGWRFRYRSEPY